MGAASKQGRPSWDGRRGVRSVAADAIRRDHDVVVPDDVRDVPRELQVAEAEGGVGEAREAGRADDLLAADEELNVAAAAVVEGFHAVPHVGRELGAALTIARKARARRVE